MRNAYQAVKRWLENKDRGKSLATYFGGYPYESVAIYGTDELAICAFHEIKDSLPVKYFIDKGAEKRVNIEGIPVIMPNAILKQEKVDAIIVADFLNYPQILEDLIEKEIMLPIVCLKDIMFEI